MSGVRLFRPMPRVGSVPTCPHATAKFMIRRRSSSPLLAPPGAVRLQASNHRLTSAGAMRSSGVDPKAGNIRPSIVYRAARCVDGL